MAIVHCMFNASIQIPAAKERTQIVAGLRRVQKFGPSAWREAWMQLQAAHWAVLPCEDIGCTTNGAPAFHTPKRLIDLAMLLTLSAPLRPTPALILLKNLAAGLSHIHNIGMIHGDVAPSNLLWSPETEWQIGDFGLARWAYEAPRVSPAGQYDFMAPETLDAGNVSFVSDVYGFGATAWAALTGKAPPAFGGALPDETPTGLMILIEQCLSDNPDDRPQNGEHLVNALALIDGSDEWIR